MVDSADTCGLRPNPQRKSCGFKKKKSDTCGRGISFFPFFFLRTTSCYPGICSSWRSSWISKKKQWRKWWFLWFKKQGSAIKDTRRTTLPILSWYRPWNGIYFGAPGLLISTNALWIASAETKKITGTLSKSIKFVLTKLEKLVTAHALRGVGSMLLLPPP